MPRAFGRLSWRCRRAAGRGWGLEAWIFSRDRRAGAAQDEDRGSRRLIIVLLGAGLAAAFTLARISPATRIRLPLQVLAPAALSLMWSGMALRLWAVLTLGRFFRTQVTMLDGHRLVTAGPYRRLRNPSYSGMLLTVLGLGLGLANWAALAVLTAALLRGLAVRIRVEDEALRRRFGADYEAYVKRTWALMPPFW